MDKINKILLDLQNPRKYAPVETVEDYFKLPKSQRTKWGFWYLLPYALPWDNFEETEKDGGWGEFYARIKKEYPIQYFIREVIWEKVSTKSAQISNTLSDFYIYCFNPQHSELRAAIPRNWQDLSSIIPDFLFACIISFVEKEDGLNSYHCLKDDKIKADKLKSRKISREERAELNKYFKNQWGEIKYFMSYYDANFENYQKLNEIYNYAKFERPKYLKTLNEGADYIDVDGSKVEWGVIEEMSQRNDDLYLAEIVKRRGMLWT